SIPSNPRFTLKKTTFFHNLDVWDVVMHLRVPERLAALADPERRARMREQALKPQRRRAGRPGPLRAGARDLRPQGAARQEPGARRSEPNGSRRAAEQARRRRDARPGARGRAR